MGNKLTLKEQIRKNERTIKRAIRDIDRERASMEREQKKLEMDIKKLVREEQTNAARTCAKMLVRNRAQVQKMYQMKANLIGVKTNIMNMKSTHAMTSAMKNTARAMVRMNKQFKIPAMQKIMKEFMKEQMKMEDMQEFMGDMIDETTSAEGEDAAIEAEVAKELERFGLEATEMLPSAGGGALSEPTEASAEKKRTQAAVGVGGGGGGSGSGGGNSGDPSGDDGGDGGGQTSVDELQSRLDNLKR